MYLYMYIYIINFLSRFRSSTRQATRLRTTSTGRRSAFPQPLTLRGQQMPSPRPWKMIRCFHSTVQRASAVLSCYEP